MPVELCQKMMFHFKIKKKKDLKNSFETFLQELTQECWKFLKKFVIVSFKEKILDKIAGEISQHFFNQWNSKFLKKKSIKQNSHEIINIIISFFWGNSTQASLVGPQALRKWSDKWCRTSRVNLEEISVWKTSSIFL